MTHREVEPEWKVEAETAAAAQAEQSMEWVKRRAAEADAVEAEKAAKTAALAKAEAARVQLRNDAIAMFDSEGAENAPFSLSLDTRSGSTVVKKGQQKGQDETKQERQNAIRHGFRQFCHEHLPQVDHLYVLVCVDQAAVCSYTTAETT